MSGIYLRAAKGGDRVVKADRAIHKWVVIYAAHKRYEYLGNGRYLGGARMV